MENISSRITKNTIHFIFEINTSGPAWKEGQTD